MADYRAPTVVRPNIPANAITRPHHGESGMISELSTAMAVTGDVAATRRHLVHVYTVIRIKVEVDAPDHRSAMEAADTILFGNGLSVALRTVASAVLEAEHADEITGYLVDEAGDDGFERSRSYGPDHEPDQPPGQGGAI